MPAVIKPYSMAVAPESLRIPKTPQLRAGRGILTHGCKNIVVHVGFVGQHVKGLVTTIYRSRRVQGTSGCCNRALVMAEHKPK
jgi:hypothetical protein